jgi:hypothetical protein
MKHTLIYICIILAGFLTACDSFLDFTPESVYTDKNFYQTANDFKAANAGIYKSMMDVFSGSGKYMYTIVSLGDEIKNSNSVNRFTYSSTEGAWSNGWNSIWNIINRCNRVLSHIDNVQLSDTTMQKSFKGEALAMRGWCYLQLAWCWGGSPIITKEATLQEVLQIPRSTQEQTYLQAESDLLAAYNLLPESWTGTDLGRISKYAAAGLLGRSYLYEHKYQDAATYLSYVMAKEGLLYKMQTNYDDCFNDAFNNSAEKVWEIQYMGGTNGKALGTAQSFCSYFIPSSLTVRTDGPLMNGITFSGPAGQFFVSQSISADTIYEPGDKRRNLSIVTGLYLGSSTPTTYYFAKKWLKSTGNPPAAFDMWGTNLPILRFTDVKLMYAEVLNELDYTGNQSDILKQINDVRLRAGLVQKNATELPDKASVFNYLVHERFVEFCFEGLRWPDLIRWGLAQEAMDKHFKLSDEGYNTTTQIPTNSMKSQNWLAPIPYSEIVSYNNPAVMWQNNGY